MEQKNTDELENEFLEDLQKRNEKKYGHIKNGFVLGEDMACDMLNFVSHIETDTVRVRLGEDSVLIQCKSLDLQVYAEVEIMKSDMLFYNRSGGSEEYKKSIYFNPIGTHFAAMKYMYRALPRRFKEDSLITVSITDSRIEFELPGGVVFYAKLLKDEDFSCYGSLYVRKTLVKNRTVEELDKSFDYMFEAVKQARETLPKAVVTMETADFEMFFLKSRSTFECMHWKIGVESKDNNGLYLKTKTKYVGQVIYPPTVKIEGEVPKSIIVDKEFMSPFERANFYDVNTMTIEIMDEKPIVLEQVNKVGSRIMLSIAPRTCPDIKEVEIENEIK